jgi:hypothetical protein
MAEFPTISEAGSCILAGSPVTNHATSLADLSASICWPKWAAESINRRTRGDIFSRIQMSAISTIICGSRIGTYRTLSFPGNISERSFCDRTKRGL